MRLEKKLQQLRKQNGLSQEQLADKLGIARQTVSKWEVSFLIRAKKNTYAGKGRESKPSRPQSHDFYYKEEPYTYYDTYLGGEKFVGEEAVWHHAAPIWSMNYAGRVIGEHFSGDFLKEALNHVPAKYPFRGPEIYTKGAYRYHSRVNGDFTWFQGYEEIFYEEERIYECYYHGGVL